MAAEYGIDFPLLEDKDLKFAKNYAGISTEGFPFPALFVLRQDGTVFFKRISVAKDKRVYVPELLSIVDSMTGETKLPGAIGYSVGNQVRAGIGLGATHVGEGSSFATDLSLSGLRDFGKTLSLGVELGSALLPDTELRAALLLRARLSYWHDVGQLYVQLPLGLAHIFSDDGATGLHSGLVLGNEFRISPTLFVYTDFHLALSFYSIADQTVTYTRNTFALGAGWRF